MTADSVREPTETPAAVRRVQDTQQQLDGILAEPLAGQIESYDSIHAVLQDALVELDGA